MNAYYTLCNKFENYTFEIKAMSPRVDEGFFLQIEKCVLFQVIWWWCVVELVTSHYLNQTASILWRIYASPGSDGI